MLTTSNFLQKCHRTFVNIGFSYKLMLTKRCYVYFVVVLHSLSSSFLDLALQLLCAYKPSLSHETKCVFIPFPLLPQMKFLHALSTSSHIDLGRSVLFITYDGKACKTNLVRVTHPVNDKDFAFQASYEFCCVKLLMRNNYWYYRICY